MTQPRIYLEESTMAEQKRLLELAMKGLEAERTRIDEEMEAVRHQMNGRNFAMSSNGGSRSMASARSPQSRLTEAGRKKLSDMMKRRWAERRRAAAGKK